MPDRIKFYKKSTDLNIPDTIDPNSLLFTKVGSNSKYIRIRMKYGNELLSVEGLKSGSGSGSLILTNSETSSNNSATHTNAVVLGYYNSSSAAYQLVTGKYSATDSDSLFIVGGGTSTSNKKNLLAVGTSSVKINTNTDISGNESITGSLSVGNVVISDNDSSTSKIDGSWSILEIGSSSTSKSVSIIGSLSTSSSLSVGSASSRYFVADSSAIQLNKSTAITGNLSTSGTLSVGSSGSIITANTSSISLKKSTSVTGDLSSTGTLTVGSSGNIILTASNSSIALKKDTTIDGNLTVGTDNITINSSEQTDQEDDYKYYNLIEESTKIAANLKVTGNLFVKGTTHASGTTVGDDYLVGSLFVQKNVSGSNKTTISLINTSGTIKSSNIEVYDDLTKTSSDKKAYIDNTGKISCTELLTSGTLSVGSSGSIITANTNSISLGKDTSVSGTMTASTVSSSSIKYGGSEIDTFYGASLQAGTTANQIKLMSGSNSQLGDTITINDVAHATNADNVKSKSGSYKTLANALLEMIYPIGSIYMSVVNTSPASFLGGTWEAWGSGRVPVGVNTNDSDFSPSEKTGGSKSMQSHTHSVTPSGTVSSTFTGSSATTSSSGSHDHTVTAKGSVSSTFSGSATTTNSKGSHVHTQNVSYSGGTAVCTDGGSFGAGGGRFIVNSATQGDNGYGNRVRTLSEGDHYHTVTASGTVSSTFTGSSATTSSAGSHTHSVTAAGTVSSTFTGSSATTSSAGSGNAGNLQPYITCYMWKRIA